MDESDPDNSTYDRFGTNTEPPPSNGRKYGYVTPEYPENKLTFDGEIEPRIESGHHRSGSAGSLCVKLLIVCAFFVVIPWVLSPVLDTLSRFGLFISDNL